MARPGQMWSFVRQNWPVFTVLVLAACAGLWFAVDIFLDFLYFNDPRNQDTVLKDWMTPRYIVHSYDLPREFVAKILGLTSPDQRGMPLRDIAILNDMTIEELTEAVRGAAADFRARQR